MRKIIYILGLTIVSLSISQVSFSQEQQGSLRDRLAKRQQQETDKTVRKSSLPRLSVRAEMKNQTQTQDLSKATWIREVYRFLDLTKGKNAALFYPVSPIEDRMNLYTLAFKLMAEGNLDAYEFNDGQDLFIERLRVRPQDMFERLEIGFTMEGDGVSYDEFSIPSNEVLGYYVKEAWYFDQSNSVLDVKTVAICPVLFRDALGGFDVESSSTATRVPQFWIPYENIRPYTARMPIMTSDINNATTKTIDDYFRLRLYDGEIYKTTNMENKYLQEKYQTPEELKIAQEKIEGELKSFEQKLWVINDSTKVSDGDPIKRKKTKMDEPKQSSDSGANAKYSARERRQR